MIRRISAFLLLLCISLAQASTWTGSVSSDFYDPSNWDDGVDPGDDISDLLYIGAGNPYDPVLNGGFPVRPNDFDVLEGGLLKITGGEQYTYGTNTINGEMQILNGLYNARGALYIGDGATGTITINNGYLDSKYAIHLGNGSGGSGLIRVIEGNVGLWNRPIIGANGGQGHIYIEPGGFCYGGGEDTAWYESLVANGTIYTGSDCYIEVDYQSTTNRTRVTAHWISGAKNPSPWNGKNTIAYQLSWDAVYDAQQYEVYFSTDKTALEASNPASSTLLGTTQSTSMARPDSLEADATYYWRVDTQTSSGVIKGELWQFIYAPEQKPRLMENLSRGFIAMSATQGNFLAWRCFATDSSDIAFNIYRNGTKINSTPISSKTNYIDSSGDAYDLYQLYEVLGGVEIAPCAETSVEFKQFYDIDMEPVAGDTDNSYEINDGAVGDLDGDGEYEYVIKRYSGDYDEYPIIDAYELDGTFLWRINLGPNHLAMTEIDPIVYDFDCDGKAEVVLRTCEGMTDGAGNYTGDTDSDGITDYRSFGWHGDGFIDAGPEFLTVFNGVTGEEMDRAPYIARTCLAQWGDTYGHRADKFHMTPAYLDGRRPSIVICRGIYALTKLEAFNFIDGKLSKLWHFDSDDWPGYAGQGNHNLTVGDVDGDYNDEIVYGGMCVDNNGNGLYTTGYGHGDAIHMTDIIPDRAGMELWRCVEGSLSGITCTDAATGELIFEYNNSADVGRCCIGDVDPAYPGCELWGSTGSPMYNSAGEAIASSNLPMNFMVWWDGDLLRETLDHSGSTGFWYGQIRKWDPSRETSDVILNAKNTYSNNWTKGTPVFSGDILGDWREEVIWRKNDNSSIRIYSTTTPTEYKIYTLMQDPQYRLAAAWQSCGYNQPPWPSFFLGDGMSEAPVPFIDIIGRNEALDINAGSGSLMREFWENATGITIESLLENTNYPDNPTSQDYLTVCSTPDDLGDNYGQRIRGFITPPVTGSYRFWVSGNAAARLLLSTDATPDNASIIAYLDSYSNPLEWDKYPSQQSEPVELEAGKKYYVEALHKESLGGDNFAVGWQLEPLMQPLLLQGAALSPWQYGQYADINSDGSVNLPDFATLSGNWAAQDCELDISIDLNGDCVIDFDDLAVVMSYWLESSD
jgi:hypothetical protein